MRPKKQKKLLHFLKSANSQKTKSKNLNSLNTKQLPSCSSNSSRCPFDKGEESNEPQTIMEAPPETRRDGMLVDFGGGCFWMDGALKMILYMIYIAPAIFLPVFGSVGNFSIFFFFVLVGGHCVTVFFGSSRFLFFPCWVFSRPNIRDSLTFWWLSRYLQGEQPVSKKISMSFSDSLKDLKVPYVSWTLCWTGFEQGGFARFLRSTGGLMTIFVEACWCGFYLWTVRVWWELRFCAKPSQKPDAIALKQGSMTM